MHDLPAPDLRHRILDAAERLIQAEGVPGLTLARAAAEAGASKGGLLHHFGSKEALLAALMERLAGFVRDSFEATLAATPEGPGRVARACLRWQFEDEACADERADRAAAVLLAAHHHDPRLLDPVRRVLDGFRSRLEEDGLPPGHGLAVWAACDGLFVARLFGLYSLSPAERAALHTTLSRLAGGAP
ncbi:MAG: TetR/AcrR family transcriptional regulator [Acetobacteraceae bacterium]|nr:TetR/AcrR family transcriptional regulator [Dehalococcoidia bacterium]MCX7685913.1 TetR/AcrR family transcriptional regulator [Acetobacteraceae bacterium]MDW8399448.1 TetR/AcrR family transcriptional regulator [Acetobacteraceae bacterium]